MLQLTPRENSLLEGMMHRWNRIKSDKGGIIAQFVSEAEALQESQKKFEIEALSVEMGFSGTSLLLQYVSSRMEEDLIDC